MEANKIRCYGIDLLRIIVMYFVVILHVCNFGGVEAAITSIPQYTVCSLYKSITCISVNVFAIISGYVGYDHKKLNLARLIELWLMIVFYGSIIASILCYFLPESVNWKDIVKSFAPITLNSYWYFSAYVGLAFLMPLINRIVKTLEKATFIKTCVTVGLVFSLYGLVGTYFNDPFAIKSGYSTLWLSILYYLGTGIKRFNLGNNLSTKKIIATILTIWCVDILLSVGLKYVATKSGLPFAERLIEYLFMSYISPPVLMLSLLFVVLFSHLKLDRFNKKLLLACSSSAFGAYIIHTNPLIWDHLFKDTFCFIAEYSSIEMLFYIPVVSLVLFLICLLIDMTRAKLFAIMNIRLLANKAQNVIFNWFDKLAKNVAG